MSEIGIITTTESGVDLAIEWKIENFFNLPEEDGAWYWSPTFSFGGEEWFLRIWPNGWRECDSSGHVDLRLYKRSTDRSIKQSFSLSLKTAKEEKYNEQNCTKVFGRIYPENYHASLRFTPRSELTMRRSELVPEGDLTVICMMKSSMPAESAVKLLLAKLDELKLNYNQALQDKAEAQTKLGVLTNNFKDKEIELQSHRDWRILNLCRSLLRKMETTDSTEVEIFEATKSSSWRKVKNDFKILKRNVLTSSLPGFTYMDL